MKQLMTTKVANGNADKILRSRDEVMEGGDKMLRQRGVNKGFVSEKGSLEGEVKTINERIGDEKKKKGKEAESEIGFEKITTTNAEEEEATVTTVSKTVHDG